MYKDEYSSDEESDGPIDSSEDFKDRHGCTDIICCGIWTIALIALCGVLGYGFMNGDPRKLHHGIDYLGRTCGVSAGVETSPLTYYCAPKGYLGGVLAGFDLSHAVCVTKCPAPLPGNVTNGTEPITDPPNMTVCGPNYSTATYATKESFKFCVPDSELHKAAGNVLSDAASSAMDKVWRAADSVAKGIWIYVAVFFLAAFLGFAFIWFLRMCARPMVYIAILCIFVVSLGLGIWMIMEAQQVGSNRILESYGEFATFLSYFFGGFLCLIAFGIFCCLCCYASQFSNAVRAVEMTSEVLTSMPSILLGPAVQAICKIISIMILMVGFWYLVSTAEVTRSFTNGVPSGFDFELTSAQKGMVAYYIFMFFWILCFITAAYQFSMAYATADYYYSTAVSPGERGVGFCAVCEGAFVGLLYHSGSFAFGSLVIAIFSVIQASIEFAEKYAQGNMVVKCIACILRCICGLCKSCAEFINKNVYIAIAIKSKSFCPAAYQAVKIIVTNGPAFVILASATWFFQILGVILITATCAFVAYAMTEMSAYKSTSSDSFLPNPVLVVIVAALIGYGISKIFMEVLEMVSSTLIFCFALEKGNPASNKAPESVKRAIRDVSSEAPAESGSDYE
jgi:hypothetical protein